MLMGRFRERNPELEKKLEISECGRSKLGVSVMTFPSMKRINFVPFPRTPGYPKLQKISRAAPGPGWLVYLYI